MPSLLISSKATETNFELYCGAARTFFENLKSIHTAEAPAISECIDALDAVTATIKGNTDNTYISESMVEAHDVGIQLNKIAEFLPNKPSIPSTPKLKQEIINYNTLIASPDASKPFNIFLKALIKQCDAVSTLLGDVYREDDYQNNNLKTLRNQVQMVSYDFNNIEMSLRTPAFDAARAALAQHATELAAFSKKIEKLAKKLGIVSDVINTTLSVLAFLAKFLI